MKIDKNSRGTIALVYLISGLAALTVFHFCSKWWVLAPVSLLLLAFCIWQTLFFRVPVRQKLGDGVTVTSVADGKVVIIEKVFEKEYLMRDCIQVSVYMDFWDVHANFWPVTGHITYFRYNPGKHLLAFLPKASEDNEHTCTNMRTENGKDIFFKQLAGTFARRIVSYSKVGSMENAGEQCGIIKFGSRIDMFLPLDAKLEIELGQQVRACETVIARI